MCADDFGTIHRHTHTETWYLGYSFSSVAVYYSLNSSIVSASVATYLPLNKHSNTHTRADTFPHITSRPFFLFLCATHFLQDYPLQPVHVKTFCSLCVFFFSKSPIANKKEYKYKIGCIAMYSALCNFTNIVLYYNNGIWQCYCGSPSYILQPKNSIQIAATNYRYIGIRLGGYQDYGTCVSVCWCMRLCVGAVP